MSENEKKERTEREDVPFGPPPEEYSYRCSVCGHEMLVNEAVVDAGIGLAKFNKDWYIGYMPPVGCPGCSNDTMEYVEDEG